MRPKWPAGGEILRLLAIHAGEVADHGVARRELTGISQRLEQAAANDLEGLLGLNRLPHRLHPPVRHIALPKLTPNGHPVGPDDGVCSDPLGVNIGRRQGDAMANDGRKGAADGAAPVEFIDQLFDNDGNGIPSANECDIGALEAPPGSAPGDYRVVAPVILR